MDNANNSNASAEITTDAEATEMERQLQEYRLKQASAAAIERAEKVNPFNELRTSAAFKEVAAKIEEIVPAFGSDAALWPHLNALRTGLAGVASASL